MNEKVLFGDIPTSLEDDVHSQHLQTNLLELENAVISGMTDLQCCWQFETSFFDRFVKSNPPIYSLNPVFWAFVLNTLLKRFAYATLPRTHHRWKQGGMATEVVSFIKLSPGQ
ncbi:hypothetical protein [Okeania sp. SIO2C9]|uniref:hypothetical protein n=1 Tax=Okeania sp. SIO2C9 TaxID=2607791 RepID=UPI0035C93DD2